MFDNIHYSYSVLLSYYTFALLLLGVIAAFHSFKVASAMKLVGLLGLLTFNVSATYMVQRNLVHSINLSPETLRLLRVIILCWLPWAIISFCADILDVRWLKLRRITRAYSALFCGLYLLIFIFLPQPLLINSTAAGSRPYLLDLQNILEIAIYLTLALFAIVLPIVCVKMGIGNTLEKGALRYWYKNTASTMFICAICQVLAFIPLYFSYFPNLLNLQQYAETYSEEIVNLTFQEAYRAINIMPIYYLFFTLPFSLHVLFILLKNSPSLAQKFPGLFSELPQISGFPNSLSSTNAPDNSGSSSDLSRPNSLDEPDKLPAVMNKSNDQQHLEEFAKRYNISKRESEVLIELIQGRSYAAIAERLYISLATVKSHIYSIYRKTEVKNKIQLLSRILNE